MPEIMLVRQEQGALSEDDKAAARRAIFGMVDGLGERGRRQWRRLWNHILKLEPGEMLSVATHLPRSGRFHRRHFAIKQALFEAQERFEVFDQFIYWIKVGAGWVTWAAGPKGGVVPIPRSISYAAADQGEFAEFHDQVMQFLRGPHAARYLWPHLTDGQADEMMESILGRFEE
ncbi:DUF1367 family protein [Pseudacidovorax intermedius]|uniref:DUF1367 family protein n=1 Tax=Pseudacidovorax intermedius TaxID=433924 RepID=UPI00034AF48D|nr:DUF1367 family protein [Pseudacidovorax intermedius]